MSNVQERLTQLEQELENARAVQCAFLPKSRTMTNLEFAVNCSPAGAIGGDVCDLFEADRGRTAVVMGDVSGKGMPAALLAGIICGAVHSSAWTASTFQHEDATERLNDLLRRKTSADRFASLFWGYYEPETSTFRYINAGHLPMLLMKRSAGSGFRVERLEEGGPILGILEWGNYQQGEVRVEDGDLLIMFSDGIIEAMNQHQDLFGEDRLVEVVRDWGGTSPTEIHDAIIKAVADHVGEEASERDDQTLVVAQFRSVIKDIAATQIREFAV